MKKKTGSGQSIRRKGKNCLAPEETLKDLCDAGDAFLTMTSSPEDAAKLVVNGKKAVLQIPTVKDVVLVFGATGLYFTLHGAATGEVNPEEPEE